MASLGDLISEQPTQAGMLGLLLFFAIARIVELVISKRTAAKAAARGAEVEPEPIFTVMVVLHTLPFALIPLEVLLLDRPFIPGLAIAAVVVLVIALVMRVWTLSTLGARWNVRIVKPDAIVTDGPYRFIRHPNYLVVILELLALPLVHSAWLTCGALTLLNALVLFFRIRAEERVLFSVPGYAEAMGKKARFVPLVL
jgi:methyltransferase